MADFVNFDGIDTFNAPDERNELFGTGPNNQTTGNENDFLFRGANDTDTYFGGSGTDRVSISPGSDAYYGNGGLNTIDFLFSFVDIWQTDKEEENAENWFATTNGVVVDTGAGTYSVTYSEFTSGVSDFDETYDGILVGFWRFTGTGGDDLFIGSNVITQTVPGGFDFGEEFEPAAGNDTIFGGAGQDTLGYFELVNVAGADGVIVDAQAKTVVKKGGLGNDIFNGIERFELSLFDDSFRGSGRDETVVGLGGNDSVNGRGGDDLLDFNFFVFQQVGITLDMDDETATTGDGGTVTFSNFELIRGSRWADTMNGGDNRDTLQGWDGDDVITGGKSGDVLYGGDDNDLLAGNGGNDFFTGDSGDDTFIGAAGTDVANYGDERGDLGVVVDLDAGTATDTHGDTDTLEGIEHVIGTDEDDTISGSDEDEDLSGGIGADTLSGRGGNDELSGEAGRDELYGQGGQDTLYGG
ncbi:MAG: calcium-binding protein, partial [Pseudomonadota bacterium]